MSKVHTNVVAHSFIPKYRRKKGKKNTLIHGNMVTVRKSGHKNDDWERSLWPMRYFTFNTLP